MNRQLLALSLVVATEPHAVVPAEAFTMPRTDPFDHWLIEHLTDLETASEQAKPAARESLMELIAAALLAGCMERRKAS